MQNQKIAIDNFIVKLEKEILTTIFNDQNCLQDSMLMLAPEDFSDDYCRMIFSVMSSLHDEGKPVNKNTVISFINDNEHFQFPDWIDSIEQIVNNFYFIDELKTNIELVKNASIKRQLDRFANQIIETKIDFAQYNNQIFDLEKRFVDILNSKRSNQLESIAAIAKEYSAKLEKIYANKKDITGTGVGFKSIDKLTNGFQPGDLIILAARPGIGKTALSLNFLLNAAKDIKKNNMQDKEKVVMFSLEMGADQLLQRLVANQAMVNMTTLRTGNWNASEWASISSAVDTISQLPILLDDSSDLSVLDIQTKLKQLKSSGYDIKLVVVDYLQLLKGPRIRGAQVNRQQEVATISRMLKMMARQTNSPIIAVAQLSRKIEERKMEDRRPMLSDLRESGAIEQDADLVTFLSRVDEDQDEKQGQQSEQQLIEYTIAKHRNGANGDVNLIMLPKYGRFNEGEKYEKEKH